MGLNLMIILILGLQKASKIAGLLQMPIIGSIIEIVRNPPKTQTQILISFRHMGTHTHESFFHEYIGTHRFLIYL